MVYDWLPLLAAVDHTIGQHSEFYWCLIETFYSPSDWPGPTIGLSATIINMTFYNLIINSQITIKWRQNLLPVTEVDRLNG